MKNILSKILIISILISNISLAQKDSTMETIVIREQVNPFNALGSSVDLKVSETLKYPGVFFDPARLAMAKAGVVNDNDQANGLSIRGNSPDALQWRLEGVEILNPNHLSNAANWNNSPATASGGVNMLSTQMLGTSSLLMGGYAAEYGNVQSGVMDMRLRAGTTDRHRFVAQLGLVGIDLAAEGPLSKNKKLTYSSNYRYSTVGLLSKLGVDFGDEKTAFQDFGVHLNYVGKKNWGAKVFYIKGNSSNTYRADLQKDSLVSIRQLSQLDFRQKNQIIGFSANGKVGENGNWKLSSVLSGNDFRNEETEPLLIQNILIRYDTTSQQNKLWSSMLSYAHAMNEANYKVGVFVDANSSDILSKTYFSNSISPKMLQRNITSNKNLLRYGFFMDMVQILGTEWKTQLGFQLDRYEGFQPTRLPMPDREKWDFLPRLSFSYQHDTKNEINYSTGFNRRLTINPERSSLITRTFYNLLRWKHQLKENATLNLEAFTQINKNTPQNLTVLYERWTIAQSADNHGIAARFEQNFDNGSFLNVNATWFRSTFKHSDNIIYSTKYDGRFASNILFGKQWQRKENRTLGINCNLFFNGGQRDMPIDLEESKINNETIYQDTPFYSQQLKHYFRSDLRVYRSVQKKHYTATLSLDIQNVTNQQNVSFQYYDAIQKGIVSRYQTGLVPILNYRVEF